MQKTLFLHNIHPNDCKLENNEETESEHKIKMQAILFLLGVSVAWCSECEIADNQVLPASNLTHTYFMRCRDYCWENDHSYVGRTVTCTQVTMFNNNASAEVKFAAPCGTNQGLFTLQQTLVLNDSCCDGMLTTFTLLTDSYPRLTRTGCWDNLRLQFYRLNMDTCEVSGRFCPIKNGKACSQILSLDCTNSAFSLTAGGAGIFLALILPFFWSDLV